MKRFDVPGRTGSERLVLGSLALTAMLSGCAVDPMVVSMPAADLGTIRSPAQPRGSVLATDSTTRKTTELLAAVGAGKLEGLKPMNMGAMGEGAGMRGDMGGMDHSQMPGMQMPTPKKQGGMDHSNMPGMAPPAAKPVDPVPMENMPGMDPKPGAARPGIPPTSPNAPSTATATAAEMKKTAAEMKKASEALKTKAEAMKKGPSPTPKEGKP